MLGRSLDSALSDAVQTVCVMTAANTENVDVVILCGKSRRNDRQQSINSIARVDLAKNRVNLDLLLKLAQLKTSQFWASDSSFVDLHGIQAADKFLIKPKMLILNVRNLVEFSWVQTHVLSKFLIGRWFGMAIALMGVVFLRIVAREVRKTMLGTVLLVLLILMLLGSVPTWPHSRNWGYYPSSGLGLVLLIINLVLVGRIPLSL